MDNECLNSDLKKAFDCVDQNILIIKMYTYGIQDQALKGFRSYLTSRVQICEVKQTMSNKRIIKYCVAQGRVSVFADDTNISFISGFLKMRQFQSPAV